MQPSQLSPSLMDVAEAMKPPTIIFFVGRQMWAVRGAVGVVTLVPTNSGRTLSCALHVYMYIWSRGGNS